MNPRIVVLIALCLVMLATRFGHLGGAWSLPDASWALFFIGGFYLAAQWRWALPVLVALAVVIDLVAIAHFGVSNYCLTPAYAFNVPAYGVLWWAGRWLRQRQRDNLGDLARLGGSVLLSVSACYLITNGSFYWLGGRVREPALSGWLINLGDWYVAYLSNAAIYITIASVLHLSIRRRSQLARV